MDGYNIPTPKDECHIQRGGPFVSLPIDVTPDEVQHGKREAFFNNGENKMQFLNLLNQLVLQLLL